MAERLWHRWISIRDASAYVARWHRHLQPPRGAIVALAAYRGIAPVEPCGVVIIGRPVSRVTQAKADRLEVTRCAVPEGERNVASYLYQRARRVAQALGYSGIVTSSLVTESGASLRGAGAVQVSTEEGRTWDRPRRRRTDQSSAQSTGKHRWELPADKQQGGDDE